MTFLSQTEDQKNVITDSSCNSPNKPLALITLARYGPADMENYGLVKPITVYITNNQIWCVCGAALGCVLGHDARELIDISALHVRTA